MALPGGIYPASVTPFDESGQIDYGSLTRLLAWFKQSGCAGVVVGGSNGEGPLLNAVEKRDLAREAVRLGDGLPVIAGLATSSLEEATWLGNQAGKAGCVGLLVMPPTFGSRDVEGVARWFEELAGRVPIPLIVYHWPQMTGVDLPLETLQRLLAHPNIGGLKTSSGRPEELDWRSQLPADKTCLVGDETLLFRALEKGWQGSISGAANVLAPWLVRLCHEKEAAVDELLQPLLKAVRSSAQPATHKSILATEGVIKNPAPRLPLLPQDGSAVREMIVSRLGAVITVA